MQINPQDPRPIFLQIQEGLETAILAGVYQEGDQIPSTTELSVQNQINPATALKGVNGLVDEGILYKKRGIGVFVSPGAVDLIRQKRTLAFKTDFLLPLLREAAHLGLSPQDIIHLIAESASKEEEL